MLNSDNSENFLVKVSVKQFPFHLLDISATLGGQKLEACFLLLCLCQRFKFLTFFCVRRVLFKTQMFQMNQFDASEVRNNLVSVVSTEVGEKSVLEARRHEALFQCLLK